MPPAPRAYDCRSFSRAYAQVVATSRIDYRAIIFTNARCRRARSPRAADFSPAYHVMPGSIVPLTSAINTGWLARRRRSRFLLFHRALDIDRSAQSIMTYRRSAQNEWAPMPAIFITCDASHIMTGASPRIGCRSNFRRAAKRGSRNTR